MRDITNKLQKRSIDYKRLIEYGFVRKEDSYEYKTKICDGQFDMIVNISDQNKTSKIRDL